MPVDGLIVNQVRIARLASYTGGQANLIRIHRALIRSTDEPNIESRRRALQDEHRASAERLAADLSAAYGPNPTPKKAITAALRARWRRLCALKNVANVQQQELQPNDPLQPFLAVVEDDYEQTLEAIEQRMSRWYILTVFRTTPCFIETRLKFGFFD